MPENEKVVRWVCLKCGNKYGKHRGGTSTLSSPTKCDICGEMTATTESRDFQIHTLPREIRTDLIDYENR